MSRAPGRHIAVIAPPTPGHLNPLSALASALGRLGHRCTAIHLEGVRDTLGEGALSFDPLPDDEGALAHYLDLLAAPMGPVGLTRMIRATAAMTARLLDEVPAAMERIGADAMLADMAEPAGALLARHLGLPFATTVTGLPLMAEPDVPPPFVGWPYRPGAVGRFRNRGGHAVTRLLMRPIARVLTEREARWGLPAAARSGQLQVAQCPAALDFPRRALPRGFRYGAPWRLPEMNDVALPDDPPLVFCSLGSLQGSRRALFAAMTGACADVGARAVVAHGGGLSEAEAAVLPGAPLVRAWWPQQTVLAQCRAAILQGGFNTVLDALAAGVPIVAVPIAFEQPATAARLAWTGAGRVLPLRSATRANLATALRTVICDPGYAQAAARLGGALAGRDGAAEAAAAISAALGFPPAPGQTRAGETTASPG